MRLVSIIMYEKDTIENFEKSRRLKPQNLRSFFLKVVLANWNLLPNNGSDTGGGGHEQHGTLAGHGTVKGIPDTIFRLLYIMIPI